MLGTPLLLLLEVDQDLLDRLQRLVEVVEAGGVGIVELAGGLEGLFLVVLGIEAEGDLVVVDFVVPEVVEHVLLPDLEVVDEFGEVVAFLHFADEGLADAEDEAALALVYHAHAVQKNVLPVSEVDDEVPEQPLAQVLDVLDVAFLEIVVILGHEMLDDLQQQVVGDVVPFVSFHEHLHILHLTSRIGKMSKLLKSIFMF